MITAPKLPGTGHRSRNKFCQTCGAPVPRNRTDKRFCTWRHDPELLTPKEWTFLQAELEDAKAVNDAS